MLFIGVDCGTQSTKVIVYDAETESIISRAAATYPSGVISDRSGQAEQHPEEWVQAVKTAVRSALQGCGRASAVRGIAVSGQQHGLVLLDRQGQVIRQVLILQKDTHFI
jgi:xylulokinase